MAQARKSSRNKKAKTSPHAAPSQPVTSFQVDEEDPFQEPFCESDMVLVVEEKRLHVHKSVLALYSPVFHAMFYGEFAEKGKSEITLEQDNYASMVEFLKHMYPVHAYRRQIKDDDTLEVILPLADYYQTEHVRLKCEDYILREVEEHTSAAACVMFYLMLCEKYNLKILKELIDEAAKLNYNEIISNYFDDLQPETKLKILGKRCQLLEGSYNYHAQ